MAAARVGSTPLRTDNVPWHAILYAMRAVMLLYQLSPQAVMNQWNDGHGGGAQLGVYQPDWCFWAHPGTGGYATRSGGGNCLTPDAGYPPRSASHFWAGGGGGRMKARIWLRGPQITARPTTSEPTASPTSGPTTSGPTALPITSTPTEQPATSDPTANPTANPTTNPTSDPTANPTVKPTANPTANPTVTPSDGPTNMIPLAPLAPVAETTADEGGSSGTGSVNVIILGVVIIVVQCALGIGYVYRHPPAWASTGPHAAANPQ